MSRWLPVLAHPAVAGVARQAALGEVFPTQLGQVVVHGEAGELHDPFQALGYESLVIYRHRVVLAAPGLGHRVPLAVVGIVGEVSAGPDLVEAGAVEAQDLALHALGEPGVAELPPHARRDLEAPHGLDLPLRRPVPDGVRSEDDSVLAEELERLPHDEGADR